MNAIAQIKSPLTPQESDVILTALNPIFDIQVLDLDLEKGLLIFKYNGTLDLVLLERRLMEAGFPLILYIYPNRIPSTNNGTGTDQGNLA